MKILEFVGFMGSISEPPLFAYSIVVYSKTVKSLPPGRELALTQRRQSSRKLHIRVWSSNLTSEELIDKLGVGIVSELRVQLVRGDVPQVFGVLRRVVSSHVSGDGILCCC